MTDVVQDVAAAERRDRIEWLQPAIRQPETLRRPVHDAVAPRDAVDVLSYTLENRQPALRQLGQGPRHGDARVRMRAEAAVEMDSAEARRLPTGSDECRYFNITRDVADDDANAG